MPTVCSGSRPAVHQQRTNQVISLNLLSSVLAEEARNWSRLWRVPDLLQRISFRRNPSLRTTVARWLENAHSLELGPRFFRLKKHQHKILCHELAHAAAVQIHGRDVSPHGPEWRSLVEAAGYAPSSILKTSGMITTTQRKGKSSPLYEHRCLVCHAVRYARRAMNSWRCTECAQSGLSGLLD